jgi:hypothetical protein
VARFRTREYSFWPAPREALGRAPDYGILHVEMNGGERWTLRGDPELVEMIRDASARGSALGRASIGGEWEARPGWPDDWDPPVFESDDWTPFSPS